MIDWALTPDGDLSVPSRLVSGYELVLQRVRLRLGMHRGEWLLDASVGGDFVGWRERKPAPVTEIVQWVRDEVSSTPGVLREIGMTGRVDTQGVVTVTGRFLLEPLDGDDPPEVALSVVARGNAQPHVITFHRIAP